MNTKGLKLAIMVSAVFVAAQARATLYDISFSGGGSTAYGQIDVSGGVADSGLLDVTAGPATGTYSLYTWSGGGISSVRVTGGTDLIVDNIVDVGANPFLDIYGLAFVTGDHSEGIDFSLASGDIYNLAGFGPLGYAVPNAFGTATLTAVPEPTTLISGALLLLPFGASTLRILRRRQVA
jgi:hypothetical protein